MYNYKDYNFRTIDTLVESVLCVDRDGLNKYKTLTESEKKVISENMAANLYRSAKDKMDVIDYADLDMTRGDITKFRSYDNLSESINFLMNMYNTQKDAPEEIPILKKTLDFLEKYSKEFNRAFTNKQEIKKMFYMNISLSLINATAMMISTTVTFIKQPLGEYIAIFRKDVKNKGDFHFKQLNKVLTMDEKGQIRTFFGSNDIIEESMGYMKNESISGVVSAVVLVTILVLLVIRNLVFAFFRIREKTSNYLLELAYFVEANYQSLNSDKEENKKIIEKQTKVVNKLIVLSDKIKIQDAKTKDVEKDIKENDEDIAVESDSSDLDVLLV